MSPNVGNFVHDLVEMAKATEELPKFQAEVERLSGMVENYAKQVQDREIAIIGYKEEIETLHAKVRSLEVERDDASFRVLEAEDTAHSALTQALSAKSFVDQLIAKLDPPKPEPVKEPEPQTQPVTTPTEGQSASDPIGQVATTTSLPDAVHSIQDAGQSESPPTIPREDATIQDMSTHSTTDVKEDGATSTSGASITAETPLPYLGKRYFDISGYVSRYDWERGGGTEEDYNWRPTVPSSY